MSAAHLIATKLQSIPKGTPFSPQAFVEFGSRNNVDKVLERLVKSGKIKRIVRGVYVCPEVSRYIGEVTPSASEIIKVKIAVTGETLQVHGAEAARQLSLSTQAPVKPIYLTNGRSRKINIEKLEIELRHTSPKKLILAGTQAGLAITALWYLGKETVTTEMITKIKERLEPNQFEIFLKNKQNMPFWMAKVVTNFEKTNR